MTIEEIQELKDYVKTPINTILTRVLLSSKISLNEKDSIIESVKRINDYIRSKESCDFDFDDTFSSF